MIKWFTKRTQKEKLQEKYEKLLAESYKLSTIDRKASDLKRAEAEEVARQIEQLTGNQSPKR
ncbi:MAG: Lacal_2735 family protein [Cytophagales bacterium]|nr:Lacal_2735 family protein [Cytophagales bacterium]MDW8384799.1 Lacal_2735 family protein [Flammeovirgaceae bacterium]